MLRSYLKLISVGYITHLKRATSVAALNSEGMCAASNKTPDGFKEVVEGSAKILYENVNNVFYNNVQEFNRDITIAVITEFVKEHIRKKGYEAVEYRKDNKTVATAGSSEDSEGDSAAVNKIFPGEKCEDGITILEALSATGLRSIRLAKEVPGVKKIVANDLSASAVAAIRRNVDYNEVGHVVEPNEDDACILMYNHKVGRKEAFDVVDVDPYGSAVPFLDAAVQAVKPQGLLCVTCTDMAVLTGVTPETCFAKYRSMPLKTKACHEQALRILLSTIELNANKYGRYIEPLISISIDFYVRVFVRVHYGQAKVKYSASKLAHVVRCGGCTSFYLYPVGEYVKTEKGGVKHSAGTAPSVGSKCNLCGCKHHMGGPIWAEPMHNPEFLQNVLQSITSFPERFKTSARMKGILTMISEELHDVPLYYITDELTSVIKCNAPQEVTLRSAILNAGYRVSSFHGLKSSIKTDAPSNVIWDILKAWFHNQNENLRRVKDGSPAMALLKRESTTENVDFTKRKDAEPDSKRKGVVRFPTMPSNWGPKARARDNSDDEIEMTDCLVKKSKRLQGKRKMQNLSNNKSNKKGKNK